MNVFGLDEKLTAIDWKSSNLGVGYGRTLDVLKVESFIF